MYQLLQFLIVKIDGLRERFGREKRQRELDSKSSGVCRRAVFAHYENMLFLNDHVKKRKFAIRNSNQFSIFYYSTVFCIILNKYNQQGL